MGRDHGSADRADESGRRGIDGSERGGGRSASGVNAHGVVVSQTDRGGGLLHDCNIPGIVGYEFRHASDIPSAAGADGAAKRESIEAIERGAGTTGSGFAVSR